jgi:hypothetical protein
VKSCESINDEEDGELKRGKISFQQYPFCTELCKREEAKSSFK